MALNEDTLVHTGDVWEIEGKGEVVIESITVCLRPMTDPAGEVHYAIVDACELRLPFVVNLRDGRGWAYKHQLREKKLARRA